MKSIISALRLAAGILVLLLAVPCVAAVGEFRMGVGVALNNRTPSRAEVITEGTYRGELIDASAVWHNALGGADVQLAWTYIMASDFGTEQAVTGTLLKRYGPVQLGGGLILGYTQAYESWQRGYSQAIPVVGPRQCIFCGITVQAAYEFKRVQFQVRYWRTDFNLYPGHNGALALITVRL